MLYNDFRPKNFEDIIGQDHITNIIKNQAKTENIGHAYLLCGTRGTGKTTTSKALAKVVNCLSPKDGEPCGECEMCKKIEKGLCIDVIEMDAASHRKIDDMRNIINTLKYPPTEAKYKVIILDEVHMLTNEAVNAFLKTLEEPPVNVIFILATTDPQKLPVTILSRCQRFNFRRIQKEEILKRLRFVCSRAFIKIEDKGLELIAKVADGAMRDALSLLEQVKSLNLQGEINYSQVLNLLGASSSKDMFELTKNMFLGNSIDCLNIIDRLDNQGKDFILYTKDLIKFLRNILMIKVMEDKANEIIPMDEESIATLKEIAKTTSKEKIMISIDIFQEAEMTMQTSSQTRITLELAIIRVSNTASQTKEIRDILPQIISELKKEFPDSLNLNNQNKHQEECSDIHKEDLNNQNKQDDHHTSSDKDITKKVLSEVKSSVINTLKSSEKFNVQQLGIALENSKMKLSPQLEIKIGPKDEKDKLFLSKSITAITKCFAKFLEKKEELVKIVIE